MVQEKPRRIFISAAETSGDAHAAALARALPAALPGAVCTGIGGDAMAAAGVRLMENVTSRSAMLGHALGQAGFYWRLLGRVKRSFREERPDVVVVVDSPAWNFHVALAAKKLGIPVLYYIAPQLWAWGAWRVKKLRRAADRVACILPFEEEWFARREIKATYVGHPLFDDRHVKAAARAGNPGGRFPTVALLPGSRGHEIERLWQPMQEVAAALRKTYPDARFLSAAAHEATAAELRRTADPELAIEVRRTGIEAVTRYADLALVASGTATLEVAAQACPMIILYHIHPLAWNLVGRWLIKTPHLSLVNILAGRALVPEYMPFYHQTAQVAQEALALLENEPLRRQTQADLAALMQPLMKPGAAARVAGMVRELLPLY